MGLGDASLRGPWSRDEALGFLDGAVIPLRLALRDPEGWPRLTSLWFVPRAGEIVCATQAGSRLARHVAAAPECAFEVSGDAPPYHGVRGRARALVDPGLGAEVLRALIQRYLGGLDTPFARWLLSRAATEVAVRLDPVTLETWDYRARMSR